jgi:hypothetical protein
LRFHSNIIWGIFLWIFFFFVDFVRQSNNWLNTVAYMIRLSVYLCCVECVVLCCVKSNHMNNGIQPVIASSNKVDKKKENLQKIPQIFFEWNSKKHFCFNNIDCVRWNIIEIIISHLYDTLCDSLATFVWRPCDESIKNQKIEKNKKTCFF